MRRSAIVVMALTACGGEAKVSFTCDIASSMTNTCTEYVASSEVSAGIQADCTSEEGALYFSPCTRPGYLGACSSTTNGVQTTVYQFATSTITTVDDAQASCTDLGGEFTP